MKLKTLIAFSLYSLNIFVSAEGYIPKCPSPTRPIAAFSESTLKTNETVWAILELRWCIQKSLEKDIFIRLAGRGMDGGSTYMLPKFFAFEKYKDDPKECEITLWILGSRGSSGASLIDKIASTIMVCNENMKKCGFSKLTCQMMEPASLLQLLLITLAPNGRELLEENSMKTNSSISKIHPQNKDADFYMDKPSGWWGYYLLSYLVYLSILVIFIIK